MKVTVTSMTGFEEAFVSMFISKRTWNQELDEEIRKVCRTALRYDGSIKEIHKSETPATRALYDEELILEHIKKFNEWLGMLLRMGEKHITVLKFIDIAIMTEGIHRAGQDDIDSHAERFDNRIIRSSTRLATFDKGEMSDWYRDKILPTDLALDILGIETPTEFEYEGDLYIKSPNGYIKKEYEGNKDVMRGLYMQSIPSNFVSKINLAQWAHVYKHRNEKGGANPEVKQWAEQVMEQLTKFHSQITRDVILSIDN